METVMRRLMCLVATMCFFADVAWGRTQDPTAPVTALSKLARCGYWSGGFESDTDPEQWKRDGYGIEYAFLAVEGNEKKTQAWYYRFQELDGDNERFRWPDWTASHDNLTDGVHLFSGVNEGLWDLQFEGDELVGVYYERPVLDDKTGRIKSVFGPEGEHRLRFVCTKGKQP